MNVDVIGPFFSASLLKAQKAMPAGPGLSPGAVSCTA
jgi:hypothetical protein